jgi:hypothetical protein
MAVERRIIRLNQNSDSEDDVEIKAIIEEQEEKGFDLESITAIRDHRLLLLFKSRP